MMLVIGNIDLFFTFGSVGSKPGQKYDVLGGFSPTVVCMYALRSSCFQVE